MQERANEFEGAAGGERRLCQTLGEEKLDEAEGGALLREGGPGPLRTRRGRRCGQEKRTKSGWAGAGQDFPHVANGVSVGKIKSGAKTGA